MNAIRLAIALIRIPRLFAYLFLLPLLLSIGMVYVQLLFTRALIAIDQSDASTMSERIGEAEEFNLAREFLFGNSKPFPAPIICRWSFREVEGRGMLELPPDARCAPDRLDVALQVDDPESFDVSGYIPIFEGNTERLHICRTCQPDLVIKISEGGIESNVHSSMGLMVLSLTNNHRNLKRKYVEAAQTFDELRARLGKIYFHAPGFRDSVSITGIGTTLAVLLNVMAIILVTLWLALKAHRKILDYFSHSGALLPMVAASGKGAFYGAIWILTMARVGAFLLAAVPITALGLSAFLDDDDLIQFFGTDYFAFACWFLAITAGLGFATIIASVAELKHRHSLLSFTYRYLPFALSILGALLWGSTFLFRGYDEVIAAVRNITAATPVFGMVPVLLGPVFEPPVNVLIIHTVLTIVLLVFVLKHNARWFAAHLEEL